MRETSSVSGVVTPTPEGLIAKMTAEIWLDARMEARFRQEPDKVIKEFMTRHGVTSDIKAPSFDELEKSPVPLTAITWEEMQDKPLTQQTGYGGCGNTAPSQCGDTTNPQCGINTQDCYTTGSCMTYGCQTEFCPLSNGCETSPRYCSA